MKRGFIIFWMLYMLFFAVPFPMILYYNINQADDIQALQEKSPAFALFFLLVSVLFWLILLTGYFKKWILTTFIMKRNIAKILEQGHKRQARIIHATEIPDKTKPSNIYELTLEFKNLVDEKILHKLIVKDSKPFERRFETGKTVEIFISADLNKQPYIAMADSKTSIRRTYIVLIFLGWLLLCIAIAAYYVYAYKSESLGYGWRFLSLGHPLLVCPATLLLYKAIINLLFRKFGGMAKAPKIKFKGRRTQAKLIVANQTGTFVNEQPMIRFELEYTDDSGKIYRQSLKKIVNLLNLYSIKQETVDIFYLKDDPQQIAFTTDLNDVI